LIGLSSVKKQPQFRQKQKSISSITRNIIKQTGAKSVCETVFQKAVRDKGRAILHRNDRKTSRESSGMQIWHEWSFLWDFLAGPWCVMAEHAPANVRIRGRSGTLLRSVLV
jgi:hypothetical protein